MTQLNWKNILLKTAVLAVLIFPCLPLKAQTAYNIFDRKGKKVNFSDVMKATKGKTHIFFGEIHTNPISHWLQVEMMKQLFETNGSRLVIGAEMFESDNQPQIDEYFAGIINQASFEKETRLWENYKTDIKPILEFAKEKELKFIATNTPRRYANAVFYQGLSVLDRLSGTGKSFIAPLPISIDTTLSSYAEINQVTGDHNGKFMMEAQALKDATMADRILKTVSADQVLLHLNGAYHTNKWQGIIAYLTPKVPASEVLVISTVSQQDPSSLEEKNRNLADFTICVNSAMTATH